MFFLFFFFFQAEDGIRDLYVTGVQTCALPILATALLEAGNYDEAMDHFRKALPSMPDAAVAYNSLGVGLVSRGKLADAIDQFREAIRLRPTYVEAYNNLGTALAFQGKPDEAV